MGEFALIESVFKAGAIAMAQINPKNTPALGIGDDCALLKPKEGELIAITSDMLVSGRHFFADADPFCLGKKSLAVNLSDLAAMGASPLGFTLSLAFPNMDDAWIKAFARGLFAEAERFNCPLIGGDTCAGPLTINITALGSVPSNHGMRRSGAQIHDDIWLSGTVGDARLALAHARNEWGLHLNVDQLRSINQRLHEPVPRIELGIALRGIASAGIDISDGLLGDLRHILNASDVSAEIWLDLLPVSRILQEQQNHIRRQCAAAGGDDYELCFTAPQCHRSRIQQISQDLDIPLTRIGQLIKNKSIAPNMTLLDQDDQVLDTELTNSFLQSFDHFK
jgi:thiamine-monophosphate kinase